MSEKRVWHKPDLTPIEDARDYEAIEYADPTNRGFEIDTHDQIIEAWKTINSMQCAECYDPEELEAIKERILLAAQEYDIDVSRF